VNRGPERGRRPRNARAEPPDHRETASGGARVRSSVEPTLRLEQLSARPQGDDRHDSATGQDGRRHPVGEQPAGRRGLVMAIDRDRGRDRQPEPSGHDHRDASTEHPTSAMPMMQGRIFTHDVTPLANLDLVLLVARFDLHFGDFDAVLRLVHLDGLQRHFRSTKLAPRGIGSRTCVRGCFGCRSRYGLGGNGGRCSQETRRHKPNQDRIPIGLPTSRIGRKPPSPRHGIA
jgi:hypothetical protein